MGRAQLESEATAVTTVRRSSGHCEPASIAGHAPSTPNAQPWRALESTTRWYEPAAAAKYRSTGGPTFISPAAPSSARCHVQTVTSGSVERIPSQPT